MANQNVALRKRQQIAKANRTMFVWIAAASVILGFASVVSYFLFNKAQFNQQVLSQKSKTADILTKNVAAASELKEQIRVLNTNQALRDAMAPGEGQPLQVVLDALPSSANSSALGASLQEKFLNADGLKIESLAVDPVVGIETSTEAAVEDASAADDSVDHAITFQFSVSSSSAAALQDLLKRLERSIRAIDITTVSLEQQGTDKLVLTVSGRAFYQPAKTSDLTEITIKPGKKAVKR